MNSLMRAKQFIAQRKTRLATVILPLAALAVSAIPAHADITYSSGGCVATLPDAGCHTSLEGTSVVVSGSSASDSIPLSFAASGSATGSLTPGAIPVSWDFDIAQPNSGGASMNTTDWTVTFTVVVQSGSSITPESITESGSTSAMVAEIMGTSAIDITAGTPIGWMATLNTSSPTGSLYFINDGDTSPHHMLVLGSESGVSSVPEPATAFLLPLGGAFLLMRRRRKS